MPSGERSVPPIPRLVVIAHRDDGEWAAFGPFTSEESAKQYVAVQESKALLSQWSFAIGAINHPFDADKLLQPRPRTPSS